MATMSKVKIAQIRKRDGSIVSFDARKIEDAVFKALAAAPLALARSNTNVLNFDTSS